MCSSMQKAEDSFEDGESLINTIEHSMQKNCK